MTLSYHKSTRDGFTLMEVVIVIAIIGLILALVGPGIMRRFGAAKVDAAKSSLKGIQTTINLFQVDVGAYPDRLTDLVRKPVNERKARGWKGPYLEQEDVPEDPWNNDYVYKLNAPGGRYAYELYSWGPSGEGAPKEEWISVWDVGKKK